MLPDLPGSFFAATRNFAKNTQISHGLLEKAGGPPKSMMCLLFAGGYDFAAGLERAPVWTSYALPSIVCLAELESKQANPAFQMPPKVMRALSALSAGDHVLDISGAVLRLQNPASGIKTYAVLLPLDQLFDLRVSSALGVWRWLNGGQPAVIQMMPLSQRKRLVLALRALDGRFAKASYREIARILFGLGDAAGSAWKGHDLRDRTIRLVRLGTSLMRGGYKRLLLYPHRRKLP